MYRRTFYHVSRCYNDAFKLRDVAAADEKSKGAAALEFKVAIQYSVHLRRIREWCSQKEKLTVLKKSGRTRSPKIMLLIVLDTGGDAIIKLNVAEASTCNT